jgi:rhamnosyltransferase
MISIVIPVKNGGADLVRCLEAIARQRTDEEVEVVVVDSGSRDGSATSAQSLGARVHSISAGEFHHGRTRNLGAQLATGDTLVFTSQDAYAASDSWLADLTAPLRDERVAGAYGRQLPHHDARPPERYFLDFLYGPEPRDQKLEEGEDISFEVTLFSNVNSAIPRRVWEAYPFADDIVMSEDQEWSRRVLRAGFGLAYAPSAAVHHSHAYSVLGAMRRFFDSGASAERSYVDGGVVEGRRRLRAGRGCVALENRPAAMDPVRGRVRGRKVHGPSAWTATPSLACRPQETPQRVSRLLDLISCAFGLGRFQGERLKQPS